MREQTTIRNKVRVGFFVLVNICTIGASIAQSRYPDSSSITPEALSAPVLKQIESLVLPSKGPPTTESERERLKVKEALCSQKVVASENTSESVKAALAITENDLAVEVQFAKGTTGRSTEAEGFSVYVEFGKQDALIRSSLPRFGSDEDGVKVVFPNNGRRLAWLEGKKGSDLLLIVPDLRECSTQAVAICPRIYVPRGTLGATGYIPKALRLSGSAKGDGLFALGSGKIGKVQASVLGSNGITLPSPWFKTDVGSTPAATVKYNNIHSEEASPAPFIEGSLPLLGASETRLDFGTEGESLRSIALRTSIQVSALEFPPGDGTTVRGAQLGIEQGPCFLISRWQERRR